MITELQKNKVYFSNDLWSLSPYHHAFDRLSPILDQYNVDYSFLHGTADIWARDYMPVQIDQNSFVQFVFHPSYLKGHSELKTNTTKVIEQNHLEIQIKYSNIVLDGGNVVNSRDKVILTERVFKENPDISKTQLRAELERLFQAEVFFIPDYSEAEDMTGHSDGYVRFINETTILVNDLSKETKYFSKGFEKMVTKAGLDYKELPTDWEYDHNHKESAIGIYINYFQLGNLVVLPVFGKNPDIDFKAVDTIRKCFPESEIETVNINEIGLQGGLLNCVSWSLKTL